MAQEPNQADQSPRARQQLSWPLILGLASLALLWPLTALTGLGGTGAPRALLILGATAVIWLGVVGFGRVARPVLTLTLTGVAYGLIELVLSLFFDGGPLGPGAPVWAMFPSLAMNAGVGALAGLVAAGGQLLLPNRGAR